VNQPKLSKPQALDVIPASEVSSLIEETDRVFVQLERELEIASAAADELEAQAAAEGIDPTASTWTMVRLQRFLEDLRDEAERDAAATIEVAQQRARFERDDPPLLVGFASDPGPLLAPPVASAPDPAPAAWPGALPRDPAPEVAHDELPNAATAAALIASAAVPPASPETPTPALMPTMVETPATNGSSHPAPNHASAPDTTVLVRDAAAPSEAGQRPTTTMPLLAPVAPPAAHLSEEFWAAPERAAAPVVDAAPATVAPVVVPVPLPPEPGSGGDVADEESRTTKGKGKRAKKQKPAKAPKPQREPRGRSAMKRLPIAAILEVIAVLLILVFILLRLS
jgi:hypothetical protein